MVPRHRLRATAIDESLAKSLLSGVSPGLREALTRDAIHAEFPAGTILYREEDEPRCGLVISGLVRVYITSPDGRQMTVRYARAGDLFGIAAILGGQPPVNVRMLTDTVLLMLNVRTMQDRGQTEPKLGWLLAQEAARRLYDVVEALAGNVFGSLRQRVARHLLDMASSRQQGRGLVVQVTQQEIADAVGSVRPVVARVIRDLRVEGIVTTSSDGIVILKPAELHANTWSRDV